MSLQEEAISQLANDYAAVRSAPLKDGSKSVRAECFDQDPDCCVRCGRIEADHPATLSGRRCVAFEERKPVKMFRVMPSGVTINVSPELAGTLPEGGQL